MAMLQFRLLGGCEMLWASGTRIEIPTKKAQALLAFLALQPGKGASRDKLANLLWSDRGDKQAQGSLRQALTTLRKALEPAETSPLIVEHGRVSLDSSAVEVDAVTFAGQADRGTIPDLDAASELYLGELLDGFVLRDPIFEEWLEVARREYRETAVRILTRLLDHTLANGKREKAIILTQRRPLLTAFAKIHRCPIKGRPYQSLETLLYTSQPQTNPRLQSCPSKISAATQRSIIWPMD